MSVNELFSNESEGNSAMEKRTDPAFFFLVALSFMIVLCTVVGLNLKSLQSNLLLAGRTPEQTVILPAVNVPKEVTVTVQNVTKETWVRGGTDNHAVTMLSPVRPLGRASVLYDPSTWIDNRHIAMKEESVPPGQTATFTFLVIAHENDMYKEYFSATHSDGTVVPNTETAIDVIVQGAGNSAVLGAVTWSASGTVLRNELGDLSALQINSGLPLYRYDVAEGPAPVQMQSNGTATVVFRIKNAGSSIWYRDSNSAEHPLHLATARMHDRHSPFYDPATWISAGRIAMKEAFVPPGQTATFSFVVHAPEGKKAYREYFSPVSEGITWIEEGMSPLVLDIAVDGIPLDGLQDVTVSQSADPVKGIKVNLTMQTLETYQDGALLKTYRISSGIWYLPTPVGSFTIHSHAIVAYSHRYHLYMDYWQAFTPEGGYGIHSLPYWKLKNGGILYEGANHIGKPVSHGCIRLAPADAEEVYNWTENGTTKVEISGVTPHL